MQRENIGPILGLTSEEREMFIAGRDLKDEEQDNNFDDYNYSDCEPIVLNSKFLFTKCYFNPVTLG